MITDYFKLSYRSIRSRRLRSWLTMIGIFIGVTAVVSLISLGQGLQDSINEEFQKIGTNRIMITPGSGSFGPTGSALAIGQITEDDLQVVKKVKGIDLAAGVLTKSAKIEYKDEVQYMTIWGFPTDKDGSDLIDGTNFFDIDNGRQFKSGDKYKVILGYSIAEDNFEKKVLVGSKMLINDQTFSVVGIQKKAGTGVHDVILRVPLDTARELFDEPEEISTIFAFTQKGFDPEDVVESIKKDLRKHRGVKEGEEDFTVQTFEELMDTYSVILVIVQAVLIGIASISLLVGGVGIMNTMYTSVLERTNEIGVMKAIGAQNKDILAIFLIESGFLGLMGGLIGVLIGIGIGKLVEFAAITQGIDLLKASFPWYLIVGSLLFSFLVGAISGVAPASQASKMKPVDALRYE